MNIYFCLFASLCLAVPAVFGGDIPAEPTTEGPDPVEPVEKKGMCPEPVGLGPCVHDCNSDADCPDNEKCCSNGCGHTCQKPEKRDKCELIMCMPVPCTEDEESYLPKGKCCPRCRPKKAKKAKCPPKGDEGYGGDPAVNCCKGDKWYRPLGGRDVEVQKIGQKAKQKRCPNKKEFVVKAYNKCGCAKPKKGKKVKPDCAAVSCLKPECGEREYLYTPKGQCCPRCKKDGTKDFEPPRVCPDEERVCAINPCELATCPACPRATCVSDYCPYCWPALFKYKEKWVDCGIVECDDPQPCLVDPCAGKNLPQGVICLSNYCGGCNAVCYKNCKRLPTCPEESGSGSGDGGVM